MIFNVGTGKVKKTSTSTEGKPIETDLLEALSSPLEQFCSGSILDGCGIEESKRLTHLMFMAYAKVKM